jgi:hypothetical protein
MIEKALFQKLSTTAAITAIVGNRIYPVFLPEKTPIPAIVFLRVSTEGAAISHTKSSGKLTSSFEVGCYGKDIQVAKNLAKLVRNTLSGFSGTVAGLVIHRSEVQNEFDDYDFDTGLFTVPVEVALTHDEA